MEAATVAYTSEPKRWKPISARVAEQRPPYGSGNREGVETSHTFAHLVSQIQQTDRALLEHATRAVNVALTLRNWLIGFHIAEFELRGSDRATYGDSLLDALAKELRKRGISNIARRQLYNCLAFFRAYPQVARVVVAQTIDLPGKIALEQIVQSLTAQLRTVAAPERLISQLSFTHFVELLEISDSLKRSFYEIEAIRGGWSVRQLRRQIASLYFERSGMTPDKEALSRVTHANAETQNPQQVIRDPYVFEFLGLKPHEIPSEQRVEDTLIEKLQEFLLELGHGFCFGARQKRLIIGGEHFFVDLVFYHRVLKCHVLVELKDDRFRHEHLGQLNAYVAWYKRNQMTAGDQPPIGILLCTQKNHELVEYALADMSNTLFVSRYQVQLPGKEEIAEFLHKAAKELRDE